MPAGGTPARGNADRIAGGKLRQLRSAYGDRGLKHPGYNMGSQLKLAEPLPCLDQRRRTIRIQGTLLRIPGSRAGFSRVPFD